MNKKIIWVAVFLFFSPFFSIAQQSRVDSLRHSTVHAKKEVDRLHARVLLAKHLMPSKMDSAKILLNEAAGLTNDNVGVRKADYFNTWGLYYWFSREPENAIAYFRQTMDMKSLKVLLPKRAQAANNMGALYGRIGVPDSTRKYLNIALAIDTERGNQRGITKTMYDLGMLHYREDKHEMALSYLLRVKDFQVDQQDTFRLIYTLNVLGNVYNRIDSIQKAIDYYTECAELSIASRNVQQEILAYNNLASIYCENPDGLEKTIFYVEKALLLAEQISDYSHHHVLYINMGIAYIINEQPEMALKYYMKAYEYNDQSYPKLQAALLKRIGGVLRLLGRYDEAKDYLVQSIDIAKSCNSLSNLSDAYLYMASIDSIQGNFQTALKNYQLGIATRDSIWNQGHKSRIVELQTKYETKKKENRIRELIQKERINKLWQHIGILVIAIVVLVSFFLIHYLQKRRVILRQKLTIQNQEIEKIQIIINSNRQELTSKALMLAKSDEMIAQLRDEIQQILPKSDDCISGELKTILHRLMTNEKSKELWKDFSNRFNELNDDFISKLLEKHHDLTPVEIRLCAMLRLQLSSKEIADLSNRSTRTIEYTRTNIRKKLGLNPNDSLTTYLLNV